MRQYYVHLVAVIAFLTVPLAAQAELRIDTGTKLGHQPSQAWIHTTNAAGFSTTLPAIDPERLVKQIKTLRTLLQQRGEKLTKFIDKNKPGVKDALITVIMPGGMIYAAYKKQNRVRAKAELTRLNEEIDELAHDLLVFRDNTGTPDIALLQK